MITIQPLKGGKDNCPPAAAAGGGSGNTDNNEVNTLLTSLLDKDGNAKDDVENDLPYPSLSDAVLPSRPTNRIGRALSIEEKAQLFDEQNEAADALSSVLELSHGDHAIPEEAMMAALGIAKEQSFDRDDEDELLVTGMGVVGTPYHHHRKTPTPWWKRICGGEQKPAKPHERHVFKALMYMIVLTITAVAGTIFILWYGETSATNIPKRQPIGPYRAVEVQEGDNFFNFYNVYNGPDSKGSNGYIYYRNLQYARENGLITIVREPYMKTNSSLPSGSRRNLAVATDEEETKSRLIDDENGGGTSINNSNNTSDLDESSTTAVPPSPCEGCDVQEEEESFIYIRTQKTEAGPRDSVRLEGKRRFNRGLFILDVRHMPAGCGTWPAFWLVDELNWPVNGEIDILEGVNYQTVAKTALHSSEGCTQYDLPEGLATGGWDTAVGIPDAKTGIPDMTLRYAKDCFVYDKHQWINQGCVAVDDVEGRLGEPLNEKGGGIYVLEWDPVNRYIRSWVFTPHEEAPQNLLDAIDTADHEDINQRISPDPKHWPLPYGYYAIGKGTKCPASHFQNMHLVFNLALCGSVAGNRYFMDCPKEFKQYPTCNQYIASDPEALSEAYWKIKGVYVYEREWQRDWNGTAS